MMCNIDKAEALLESDDELPLYYHEEPATPAYQIDSRFDSIKFPWINNLKTQISLNNSKEISLNSDLNKSQSSYFNNKPIIKQGVLLQNDLYCIKSIEGLADDSTLIWLINFLLQKDLQSKYPFLKSCLIREQNTQTTHLKKSLDILKSDKHKIVIKL